MTKTHDDARRFAVIASQRTGSTLLVRSLDASPLIFCAGEIFHGGPHVHHHEFNFPRAVGGSLLLGLVLNTVLAGRRIRNHLDRFYSTAGDGVRAVGFKVMASQLRSYHEILPSLVDTGATLLFLYRRDSFATALSYYRAKSSGVYHSDRIADAGMKGAVTADLREFGDLLTHCELEKAQIQALHSNHGGVLLAYEDMWSNWDTFVDSVGRALGIAGLKLNAVLEKLDATAPRTRIENEDALRREFADRASP